MRNRPRQMVSFSVSYWLMDCTKWCDMPFKWNLQVIYCMATALLMILIPGICVFLLWILFIYPGEGRGQMLVSSCLLAFVLRVVYVLRFIPLIHITASLTIFLTVCKQKKGKKKSSLARKLSKPLDKYIYVKIQNDWRVHSSLLKDVYSTT